jgi:hypothetical protein
MSFLADETLVRSLITRLHAEKQFVNGRVRQLPNLLHVDGEVGLRAIGTPLL